MDLQLKKQQFLEAVEVDSIDQATWNALRAALRHNRTYNDLAESRKEFQYAFKNALLEQKERYYQGVEENIHIQVIERIVKKLSDDHGAILQDECLRIGTVQKALNLYLKIIWCLEPAFPEPPHCPIDSIILKSAQMSGKWTKLNSISIYKDWIAQLKRHAIKEGYTSLSEWELNVWTP